MVELGHWVVWELLLVLLPQTLLLQDLPGSFTLLQRDPRIHQRKQFKFCSFSYICKLFINLLRDLCTSVLLNISLLADAEA